MARQNIDEDWKTDPRRKALVKLLGGERLADGMRVEVNWLMLDHKGKPVPLKKFKFVEDYQAWIDCGLAEIKGEYVEIAGADRYDKFFEKQADNGSKGGRPLKNNPEKPKITQTPKAETQKKPEKPSSSSSSSFSKSKTNTNTLATASQSPVTPVGVYVQAYEAKYGHRPEIGGRQAGIISTFAKGHPGRWEQLIRGFLEMPDSWAVQRSHPVELLETKVNEIVRFLETGKVVTRKVVQHAEELIDKAQGTNKRPRKSIEELERERAEMMAEANVVPMIAGRTK